MKHFYSTIWIDEKFYLRNKKEYHNEVYECVLTLAIRKKPTTYVRVQSGHILYHLP
jgi:hypothetical protein